MLTISLTPDTLIFRTISEEVYNNLVTLYNFQDTKRGPAIKGKPEDLYKILFKLSYTYDIEII